MQGKREFKVVFMGDIRPGYANKLYGFLSSLLIAILTDSALVVEWKDIEGFVEEPLWQAFHRFNSTTSLFSSQFRLTLFKL